MALDCDVRQNLSIARLNPFDRFINEIVGLKPVQSDNKQIEDRFISNEYV